MEGEPADWGVAALDCAFLFWSSTMFFKALVSEKKIERCDGSVSYLFVLFAGTMGVPQRFIFDNYIAQSAYRLSQVVVPLEI